MVLNVADTENNRFADVDTADAVDAVDAHTDMIVVAVRILCCGSVLVFLQEHHELDQFLTEILRIPRVC